MYYPLHLYETPLGFLSFFETVYQVPGMSDKMLKLTLHIACRVASVPRHIVMLLRLPRDLLRLPRDKQCAA